jgi:hypothetical protein
VIGILKYFNLAQSYYLKQKPPLLILNPVIYYLTLVLLLLVVKQKRQLPYCANFHCMLLVRMKKPARLTVVLIMRYVTRLL